MRSVLHVTVAAPAPLGNDVREKLGERFEKSLGWLRYTKNTWLIVSNRTASHWADVAQEIAGERATVLVMRVDLTDFAGYLPDDARKWIAEVESVLSELGDDGGIDEEDG